MTIPYIARVSDQLYITQNKSRNHKIITLKVVVAHWHQIDIKKILSKKKKKIKYQYFLS